MRLSQRYPGRNSGIFFAVIKRMTNFVASKSINQESHEKNNFKIRQERILHCGC